MTGEGVDGQYLGTKCQLCALHQGQRLMCEGLIAALQVGPLIDPSSLGIGRETEAQRIFLSAFRSKLYCKQIGKQIRDLNPHPGSQDLRMWGNVLSHTDLREGRGGKNVSLETPRICVPTVSAQAAV